MIPSQSQGSPGGFEYFWDDDAGLFNGATYYYWLDDVDVNNVATRHGPVSVDFTGPTALTLSDVSASPAAGAVALPTLWIVAGAGAARRLAPATAATIATGAVVGVGDGCSAGQLRRGCRGRGCDSRRNGWAG